MAIPTHTILEELVKIPAIQKMKVCAQRSIMCGALVGTVTAISGLIAGPVGIAAGGILSSSLAAVLSNGKFNSIPYILNYETTKEEQKKLGKLIVECLHSHHIYTIYEYVNAIKNDPNLQQMLVQIVITFVTSGLGRTMQT